jgi:hypothetical protein
MIETHVEAFVEARGKILQPGVVAANASMADQAHRYGRRGELAAMTVGTRFVTGKPRGCGVVGSFVTRVAGKGTVPLAGVKELRVVLRLRGINHKAKKNHAHKSAKPQRQTSGSEGHNFAPWRPGGKILHLTSLRFNGGRPAIR